MNIAGYWVPVNPNFLPGSSFFFFSVLLALEVLLMLQAILPFRSIGGTESATGNLSTILEC